MSNWKRRKNYNGKNKDYSISNKLRKEKRSHEEFEIMLNSLTLEEVIGLKLELASRNIANRLYGLPIWSSINHIIKEAVLKYALSATRTQAEAMRFLGLNQSHFHELRKKYKIKEYFLNQEEEE